MADGEANAGLEILGRRWRQGLMFGVCMVVGQQLGYLIVRGELAWEGAAIVALCTLSLTWLDARRPLLAVRGELLQGPDARGRRQVEMRLDEVDRERSIESKRRFIRRIWSKHGTAIALSPWLFSRAERTRFLGAIGLDER